MTDIQTDHEFANLCRALTTEEKAQLEGNLKKDGCTDPLKLWGDILLDGHNRLEICTRLNLPFKTEQIDIKDRGDALNWVIANQLGRRNLIPEDVAYLRGKRYEAEKKNPINTQIQDGVVPQRSDQNDQAGTDARLGKEFGVGSATIRRDAVFASAVDKIDTQLGKDVAAMIRTGKSGLTKKAIIEFAKDDDMTLQKFNDLRFEQQQRRQKQTKARKKSAPKHGLTVFKKSPNALDTTHIERMRPFMNAVIQIATGPVTAETLAGYQWPDNWRKQMVESLPEAIDYLNAFAAALHDAASQETDNGDGEVTAA
jgi:hypothetical protein